uniref:DNA-directed DNA polymerase n=1 Tax=Pithovirus LCPAC103 TaxID=2506588 RepID=A0A481Z6S5_9VIRU|nr:MAG: DNA polymerase elongation subunit family B [Pithovirus LCPAC103]
MITVQPYDWSEQDEKVINRRGTGLEDRLTIYAWCVNRRSEPVLLRINDYYAICHLELPLKINGRAVDWTRGSKVKKILDQVNTIVKAKPFKALYTAKRTLYYFDHHQKYPMFLLLFTTKQEMWRFKKYVEIPRTYRGLGSFPCQVHEAQISSVRKLMTTMDFTICQELQVSVQPVAEMYRISNLEHEYICSYKHIKPLDAKLVVGLKTNPRIVCFDIEAWNGMKSETDPMIFPVRDYAIHVAYMISVVFQRVAMPETRKIYLIVMGDCNPIPGFEIIRVNTETELCDTFADLIDQLDPEIMMSYNGLGFDYPYLDARLKLRGRQWKQCGRLPGKPVELYQPAAWSSSGKGFNKVRYLQMPGRIEIDMLKVVRSEHKLPDNRLETAAQHFLGRGKSPVTPLEMFLIYGEFVDATKMMKTLTGVLQTKIELEDFRYGILDEDLRQYWCPAITRLASFNPIPDCEQIVERYIKAREEMTRVSEYCGNDSILPLDMFEFLGTWIKTRELANTVCVTPMDTFLRGEQVKCVSLIYDILTKNGVVMNTIKAHNETYEGGFVGEPHPGLWRYVITLDFKSMYPSIIIAYNMCYSTLIPPELWGTVSEQDCYIIRWTHENEDDTVISYEHRFVKEYISEGYLPQLCRYMIDERNAVRKQIPSLTDPKQKAVYQARQLALKVTGNSFYGFLGTGERGYLPCGEISSCVTAKGRELIQYCNKYLEDTHNGFIVYNDTDSTMVKLPFVNSRADCRIQGKKLEIELSALFPDPLYFEHEYSGDMFSLEKKMYAMKVYGKADDGSEDYMSMKGIAPVRRDRCKKVKTMYTDTLETIFNDELNLSESMHKAHKQLFQHCLGIMRREVTIEEIEMIKGLGKDYKSDSYFMKVFADELKRRGRPAEPGSKLHYVVVDTDGNLGHRMRLPEQYFEVLETDQQETLDYLYYVRNGQNIIDRMFGVAYAGILDERRAIRQAFAASRILKLLEKQELGHHIEQARIIRAQETGQLFTTDEVLVNWITEQVICHSVGQKKKVIQALKTKTIKLHNNCMNSQRMVTGVITQNPILSMVNLFEAKRELCRDIEAHIPLWELQELTQFEIVST